MQTNLSYRPRLSDMTYLGASGAALATAQLEAPRRTPRTTPAETFTDRAGYRPDFLGDFTVALPTPLGAMSDDVLPVSGRADGRLDYQHFSVVMSKARRMAMVVAVNIDGRTSVKIVRGQDKWSLDGRIPADAQWGEDLYADNLLDRGHLVRREDPNWGSEDAAQTANEDTFHFTNCAPQMGAFNQRTWLSLESYILDNTRRWEDKVTVMTGPVFRDTDLTYRGARIPSAYWKVVAFLSEDGKPSATAYMLDQVEELRRLEAAFGAFRTYQRSIRQIELMTNLDFGVLRQFDGFTNEELASGARLETVIDSFEKIRV